MNQHKNFTFFSCISRYKLRVISSCGYSLVELMTVVGMMAIILSIGGLSLSNVRNMNSIDYVVSQVQSELRRAQSRSENGIPAGVFFDTNRFVYFEGATYQEGVATNEETLLPQRMTFSEITFSNNIVQFDGNTSYLHSFVDPSKVVFADNGTGVKVLSINRWGVIEIQNL